MGQHRAAGMPMMVLFSALLVLAAYLTWQQHEKAAGSTRVALPNLTADSGHFTYSRLAGPGRTVVRDGNGAVVARFTDGARTVVLKGPMRTFRETGKLKGKPTAWTVQHADWVRFAPKPWKAGAERSAWFRKWFPKLLTDRSPDMFAIAMQYVSGTPVVRKNGLKIAGDAGFGPPSPHKKPGDADYIDENSDFYDYLGIRYRFKDGVTEHPSPRHYRFMDCTGFLRTVLGYRMGFPMASERNERHRTGLLPRRAWMMDEFGPGVVIVPHHRLEVATEIGALQPGDMLFFDIDARPADGWHVDHSGIYLGLDTKGHPRFISSREDANGPTFSDIGGSARLDIKGPHVLYATHWRSAKRL